MNAIGLWGLFLIVTEHGFRWEKRESKTRHGNFKKKDYGDFILKTKSDLDKYPFLYEMSHMFCEAFTMTSPFAYKVTHDSIQPEGYIAYDETDGIWRPYLQQHAFRWLYPQFKHGNQYFKCLKHVKHNGLPMYIKTNPNDGLSASAKKSKKWSHSKFTKEIEEFEVEYKTPQGIQKGYLSSNANAPMPRREFKTNYKANESVSKHVKKMEEEFNKAVNEEAERCGTSDYIGIFSGRKLEDIRKALEKLEAISE